ncbi:MAG: glycosyltransferase, partial [Candidatus Onthomorpha sp.]|nr:glycosyltransferase [Bacteroidales bacterium]MDY5698752.1 glycosyltransferase [Candidatus Onthomorpha sp.]
MTPVVSVITVCFNAARDLQKTIESVRKQSYNNIEYVIVDG